MAKARSGLLTKISGSVGATQFRQTRYGLVLCNTTIPVNRWSPAKESSNHRFGNTSRLWAKVKYQDVDNWNQLADTINKTDKLGNEYSPRANDVFKHVNRYLFEINEPVIFVAPKKVLPKLIESPEIDLKVSERLDDLCLFFKKPIHKDTKYIIYATHPVNNGRNSPKDSWFKKFAVIDSTFLSGYSLINEYLAVHQSNIYPYYRIFFRIKPVSRISGFTLPIIKVFACNID